MPKETLFRARGGRGYDDEEIYLETRRAGGGGEVRKSSTGFAHNFEMRRMIGGQRAIILFCFWTRSCLLKGCRRHGVVAPVLKKQSTTLSSNNVGL